MRTHLISLCAASCLCWWATAQVFAQCPGPGDCFIFEGNGTPGCDDAACCITVCAVDSFCCENEWDDICADEAADICMATPEACCLPADGSCQDLAGADCVAISGTPQGFGTICEGVTCTSVCGAGAGDCFATGGNGTPGCDNVDCCNAVCADDPFCCDTQWDSMCAGEAPALCSGATCTTCPGDVNSDNNRDGRDIASMVGCLLNAANGPGLPPSMRCACGDTGGDGDVDVNDVPTFVNGLLNSTGPCP